MENDVLEESPLITCTHSWRDKQQESSLSASTLLVWLCQKTGSRACMERHMSARCHQLPFNHFKGFPSPPPCNSIQQHFLTDVQRIPQWPQHPAAALKKPAWGCSSWQPRGDLLSSWSAPNLNNHSWSWSGRFWWNDFLLEKETL